MRATRTSWSPQTRMASRHTARLNSDGSVRCPAAMPSAFARSSTRSTTDAIAMRNTPQAPAGRILPGSLVANAQPYEQQWPEDAPPIAERTHLGIADLALGGIFLGDGHFGSHPALQTLEVEVRLQLIAVEPRLVQRQVERGLCQERSEAIGAIRDTVEGQHGEHDRVRPRHHRPAERMAYALATPQIARTLDELRRPRVNRRQQ